MAKDGTSHYLLYVLLSVHYYGISNELLNQKLAAESDLRGLQSQMSAAELTLKNVAGLAQVETLAVVVEEQRLRTDSILHGFSNSTLQPLSHRNTDCSCMHCICIYSPLFYAQFLIMLVALLYLFSDHLSQAPLRLSRW